MKTIKNNTNQKRCFRLKTPQLRKERHKKLEPLPLLFNDMQQQAIDIVKNNHYIYMDLSDNTQTRRQIQSLDHKNFKREDSFIRQMELVKTRGINPSQQNGEEQEEMQKLDRNTYIKNLGVLSTQTQKMVDYMIKQRQMKKRKQEFRKIHEKTIKNSKNKHRFITEPPSMQKTRRRGNLSALQNPNSIYTFDNQALKNKIQNNSLLISNHQVTQNMPPQLYMHQGMKISELKEYLKRKNQYETNLAISKKESKLLSRYGYEKDFPDQTLEIRPFIQFNQPNHGKDE